MGFQNVNLDKNERVAMFCILYGRKRVAEAIFSEDSSIVKFYGGLYERIVPKNIRESVETILPLFHNEYEIPNSERRLSNWEDPAILSILYSEDILLRKVYGGKGCSSYMQNVPKERRILIKTLELDSERFDAMLDSYLG